ncbi:MAG: SEC-C domain-containing protein [Vallitaleaceae bacterium]|nr:SEC-C domain-containing protein [Vallitaleaceae bacterium]
MSGKGSCNICKKEFTKAGFTKHLKKCIDEQSQYGKEKKYIKRNAFLIKIEAKYNPDYFLYILMDVKGTLKMLDDFLRGIWLECCGHLSNFYIGYNEFIVDYNEHSQSYDEDLAYSMDYKLEQVLADGYEFLYTYDFGTSTELKLSIKSYHENVYFPDAVTILARNHPIEGDEDNSPRSGECGYTTNLRFHPSQLDLKKYPFLDLEDEWDDWDEIEFDDEEDWNEEQYGGEGDEEEVDEELMDFLREQMAQFLKADKKDAWKYILKEDQLSFEICLATFTIDEIKELAKGWDYRGRTNLKKGQLIQAVIKHLIESYKNIIPYMTDEKFQIIKTSLAHQGLVLVEKSKFNFDSKMDLLNLIYTYLMFPIQSPEEDKLFLRLPKELCEALEGIDFDDLERITKQNKEVIDLARGYAFYYGVINLIELHERVNSHLSEKVDLAKFEKIIKVNEVMDSSYFTRDDLVAFGRILDPYLLQKSIKEAELKNKVLEYKEIKKKDLLNVSGLSYFIKTKEVRELEKYIRNNFHITKNELDELIQDIMIQMELVPEPKMLLENVLPYFELHDQEEAEEVLQLLIAVYNKNRLWINKGYSPSELFGKTKLQSKTIAPNVLNTSNAPNTLGTNITPVDFVKKAKIGRNDSCPCGSGKKYKNCCGK